MPGRWIPSREPWSSQARHVSRFQRHQPSAPARILRGSDLGPTREDAHQTFRTRADGTSKELPLPPLLDQVVLENVSRFKQAKAKPRVAEQTPSQKKLAASPYAHALASTIRQCRMTLVSLPDAFLTSLHVRPHPITADLWLLPLSLTTSDKHLGSPFRFLGRRSLVEMLGVKRERERTFHSRVLKLDREQQAKLVWRQDMPDLVQDLMQKRLSNKLRWNLGHPGRLIPVHSPRTEDIEGVGSVSCILAFKTLRSRADDMQDRSDAIAADLEKWAMYFGNSFGARYDPHTLPTTTHTSPWWYNRPLVPHLQPRLRYPELEFKTTTWRGKKVAVYSLPDLLGQDAAQQLIKESKYDGEDYVVVPSARHNVPIGILLMQLQAYIAGHKP